MRASAAFASATRASMPWSFADSSSRVASCSRSRSSRRASANVVGLRSERFGAARRRSASTSRRRGARRACSRSSRPSSVTRRPAMGSPSLHRLSRAAARAIARAARAPPSPSAPATACASLAAPAPSARSRARSSQVLRPRRAQLELGQPRRHALPLRLGPGGERAGAVAALEARVAEVEVRQVGTQEEAHRELHLLLAALPSASAHRALGRALPVLRFDRVEPGLVGVQVLGLRPAGRSASNAATVASASAVRDQRAARRRRGLPPPAHLLEVARCESGTASASTGAAAQRCVPPLDDVDLAGREPRRRRA